MYAGKLIFAQITDQIHPEQFRRCVRRYNGDYKVKTFSCWNQFLCMAFGQLTFRESLRDVETCLRSRPDQLYHLGIRGEVSHSTLADANRERDWRIYHDLAQRLIGRARSLYANEAIGLELNETVYALDSTTIDLCLSLFPWALPPSQGGNQTAHAVGFARLHPCVYLDFPWETGRCPRPGRIGVGAGILLCDGSCLRRFPTALLLCTGRRLFCDPIKIESPIQPRGIPSGGLLHRSAQRSNHLAA